MCVCSVVRESCLQGALKATWTRKMLHTCVFVVHLSAYINFLQSGLKHIPKRITQVSPVTVPISSTAVVSLNNTRTSLEDLWEHILL